MTQREKDDLMQGILKQRRRVKRLEAAQRKDVTPETHAAATAARSVLACLERGYQAAIRPAVEADKAKWAQREARFDARDAELADPPGLFNLDNPRKIIAADGMKDAISQARMIAGKAFSIGRLPS